MGMSRIHVAMFKNILHDQYSSEEEKYFGYEPVNEYGVLCCQDIYSEYVCFTCRLIFIDKTLCFCCCCI